SRGREKGEFTNLQGISTSSSGRIVVADSNNQCVQVLALGLGSRLILALGCGSGLWLCLGCGSGFWARVLALGSGSGCRSPGSVGVRRAGAHGAPLPPGPHFVAVNNKNEIVVTDFHNHSVKVYSADGEFLFKFGSHGEGNGQFNAPTGVAVDANGNIIVADW
ncbi:tripartite motif-containing protein 3-like, partial [Columba livia]